MQNNPFWQYSQVTYSLPGVEPLLLKLQGEVGADVNIVLCCCWLGQQGLLITGEQLESLLQYTARWRAECIVPLRSVRTFLKGQGEVVAFRNKIKALELEAERHQQTMLYRQLQAMVITADGTGSAILSNLRCYIACLPGLEWQAVSGDLTALVRGIDAN